MKTEIDNMEYSHLDAFQIHVGPPPMSPHKCAACGRYNADKFIDWNFQLDFYGNVYLCLECFTQCANQLQYMDSTQWERVVDELHTVEERCAELEEENEALKGALRNLGIILDRDLIPGVPPVGEVPESNSDAGSRKRNPRTKPRPAQSNDGRRSTDISGDDTLDGILGSI